MRLRFALVALGGLTACGAVAAPTNELSDAQVQGRKLAQQLLEQRPATNFVQIGTLKIRDPKGRRSEIPIRFQTITAAFSWTAVYETTLESNQVHLLVTHEESKPNRYELRAGPPAGLHSPKTLSGNEAMIPFAGSDFWAADFGLEFLHWPEQKLVKQGVWNGRGYSILESINPDPSTNGYSRVESRIDSESFGILHAEAYDVRGDKLKEYDTKKLRKVNGLWQVESMEIGNVQTDSRTQLKFDLNQE